MIQLKNLSFSRDSKRILDNANLTIHAGQKVGLIGANGCGKTSLIKLLKNEISSDEGSVNISKQLVINHLRQDIVQSAQTAVDYVTSGDQIYQGLTQQLNQAEKNCDGMAIAELHMKLAEIDGYSIPAKAGKILAGLGFSSNEINNPINTFSGGWQMRLNLAQLLISRADILLLDEPTNHLDMEAISWLENWLQKSSQTIILVSHDRNFLDSVVTHIAHLQHKDIKFYTGNYSRFEKQRAEQLMLQQANYEKQQAKKAHLQKYVDRFRYKASKARQAQSRIKMLEKMEQVAAVQLQNPFQFHFKPIQQAGNPMLTLDHVALGYDNKTILRDINASIRDGDRIGLIGPNGAGKSTLIKLLAQQLSVQAGELHQTNKIKVGYFAQHQLELLQANEHPLYHLSQLDKSVTESKARQYLGSFAFSNDDVFRAVGSFSGGEKARLVLALIIWQAPNLLLLDEPTNHLDLEMREALNLALQDYQGALVLVSHDRYLLNCVTNELWLVADGSVTAFEGDLQDYRRWFNDRNQEKPEKVAKKPNVDNRRKEQLEKSLANYEEKLKKIDDALSDTALYSEDNKAELDKWVSNRDKIKAKLDKLETELLNLYRDE